MLAVMGLSRAEFVNFDLFDNQGVPPLILMVSGGSLTENSFQDLISLMQKAKGVQNFHKMLLLETESSNVDVNGREVPANIEVKDMMEYRKDDAMFLNYMTDSRKSVRQFGFRLPGMFVGETTDYNYATAKVARETAEEQVFVPERRSFDEIINRTVIKALGYDDVCRFVSRAPVIRSNEELLDLLPILTEKGAFTINELISFTNEHFGTDLQPYDEEKEEWANQPIPFVFDPLSGVADFTLPEGDDLASEKTERVYKALLKLEKIAKNLVGEKYEHAEEEDTEAIAL